MNEVQYEIANHNNEPVIKIIFDQNQILVERI